MPGASRKWTRKSRIVTRAVAREAARRLAKARELDEANLGTESQTVSADILDVCGTDIAEDPRPDLPMAAEDLFSVISTPSMMSRAQSPQARESVTEWEEREGAMEENSEQESEAQSAQLRMAIFKALGLPQATRDPIAELSCLLKDQARQDPELPGRTEGEMVREFYSCPNLPVNIQPQRAGNRLAGNSNFAPKMAACQPLTISRDYDSPAPRAHLPMPYPSGAAMPAAREKTGPSAGLLMPPATVGKPSLTTPCMSPPPAIRSYAQAVKETTADRSTISNSSPTELEIDAAIRTLTAAFGTAIQLPPRPKTTQAGQECHLPPPSGSSPYSMADEVPVPSAASSPAPRFQRGPAVPRLEFLQGRPTATPAYEASSPAPRFQRGPAIPELQLLQSPGAFHLPGDALQGRPKAAPVFFAGSGEASAGTAPPQAKPRIFQEELRKASSSDEVQPRMEAAHAQKLAQAQNELSFLTAEKKAARIFKTAASVPMPFCEYVHLQNHGPQQLGVFSSVNTNSLPSNFRKLHSNGSNLLTWAKEVQMVLMEKNVLFMLLEPPERPWSLDLDCIHHKAFCILLSAIDSSIYPSIPHNLTVSEIWEKLFNLYYSKNRSTTTRISREFHAAKLKPGVHISEHLCSLNGMREELMQRGEIITEGSLVSIIINSLDSSWDNFVSKLDSNNSDSISLETLSGKLIAEYNLRMDRGLTHKQPKVKKAAASPERVNSVSGCFICGSRSHFKRECPKYYKNKQQGREEERKRSPTGDRKGHRSPTPQRKPKYWKRGRSRDRSNAVSDNINVIKSDEPKLNKKQREQLWLLDSGASAHIISDKSLFTEFKEKEAKVKVANGKVAKVSGQGSTYIPGLGLVRDILYVPEIDYNLLSTLKLTDNDDIEVVFAQGQTFVTSDGQDVGEVVVMEGLPYYSPRNVKDRTQEKNKGDNGTCGKGKGSHKGTANGCSKRKEGVSGSPKKRVTFKDEGSDSESEGDVNVSIGKPLHEQCAHLLHRRLGHISFPVVKKMPEHSRGLQVKDCKNYLECAVCRSAKSKDKPHPKSSERSTDSIFELVHMDLVGPLKPSVGQMRYFLSIVDDHSRFGFIYTLKSKSETFGKFREFYKLIENQHGIRVKKILTDRGTEFLSNEFQDWLKDRGVVHLKTTPFSAFQNGVAERRNGVLQTMVRCTLEDARLPDSYWAEAVAYANYTLNRLWSSVVNKTPYEIVYGHQPKLSHLRVFGVKAAVFIPKQLRRKGDKHSRVLTFTGYEPGSKGYRFCDENGRLVVSRSAEFNENSNWSQIHANEILADGVPQLVGQGLEAQGDSSPSDSSDSDVGEEEMPPTPPKGILKNKRQAIPCKKGHSKKVTIGNDRDESESSSSEDEDWQVVRRSKRLTKGKLPKRYEGYLASVNNIAAVPRDYNDVLDLPQEEQLKWKKAMDLELGSLKKLKVYAPSKLPSDKKLIGTRWVFKAKPIENDQVLYKARLVAQGFSQRFPDDYVDTYSPTVRAESVKCALVTAAILREQVYQFDIQTAYLHAKLDKEIYVRAPPGADHEGGTIWLLKKSLYGLKQSGKRWYDCLTTKLRQIGFTATPADECVFIRESNGQKEKVLIYVDDILYIGKSKSGSDKFASDLAHDFALKSLGRIDKYLGVQIVKTKRGFGLSQKEKVIELLEKCQMTNAKPTDTPMQTDFLRHMYKESPVFEQNTLYRSVIGSLLYIANWSRPDIALPVNLLSRHVQSPTRFHWEAVKKLLRYLLHTADSMLLLEPKVSDAPLLTCWADSDWAGDTETRKSTSGYVVFLNGCPVHWYTGKQKLIATSTAEAEYVCLSKASNDLIWFDDLLGCLWAEPVYPIQIQEDNRAAIDISKADVVGSRSRHIDIKYKHVRQLYKKGFIEPIHCDTKEQIADVLTKPLSREQHHYLIQKMGLIF